MEYSSPHWNLLIPHKHSFMSEKVILQYIGFVKTHKKLIDSKKHTGTARERKLFYQVFHKLLSLESYVNGGDPIVKCNNEGREFILRVRRGPLEVTNRDNLLGRYGVDREVLMIGLMMGLIERY